LLVSVIGFKMSGDSLQMYVFEYGESISNLGIDAGDG
jgi:hypothetical protein